MTITPRHKLNYFALYYGQDVLKSSGFPNDPPVKIITPKFIITDNYLELRSVGSLSEEEVIELGALAFPNFSEEQFAELADDVLSIVMGPSDCNDFELFTIGQIRTALQWLCTKGVAVPYLNHRVEDLISEGVIKIKEV